MHIYNNDGFSEFQLKFENLGDYFEDCAKSSGALTFFTDGGTFKEVPYSCLYTNSLKRLKYLRDRGVEQGASLLLVCTDLQLFVESFWACILGGIISVPLLTPVSDETMERIARIASQHDDPWLLTDSEMFSSCKAFSAKRVVKASEAVADTVAARAEIHGDDIAYLQYSSGSTSEPKGVIISHKNVITNCGTLIRCFNTEAYRRSLSWMPLTHDMGLILHHIAPIVACESHMLIPTELFRRDPEMLLDCVSKYRATFIGLTNSMVAQLAVKPDERRAAGWDLSSLLRIVNGAEQVDPDVTRRFLDVMGRYGLKPFVMKPSYGLAEATLGVLHTPSRESEVRFITVDRGALSWGDKIKALEHGSTDSETLVSVGIPFDVYKLRIADTKGSPCPEGTVGMLEAWSDGSNARGYWRAPELSKALYTDDGWLITGDLAFCEDGHYYIAGRVKDLIIIGGVNYYPHDFENIAARDSGINASKIAAVSVPAVDGGEDLGIFIETEAAGFEKKAMSVSKNIVSATGLLPAAVLRVDSIPRTSSGKVRRFVLSDMFRKGDFEEQMRACSKFTEDENRPLRLAFKKADGEEIKKFVSEAVAQLCGATPKTDVGLMQQGLTSLRMQALRKRLSDGFGIKIESSFLFDYPTIDKISSELARRSRGAVDDKAGRAATTNNRVRVAVTAMACRLPGARNVREFEELLKSGKVMFKEAPSDRGFTIPVDTAGRPGFSRTASGAWLDDFNFNASLFGLTPSEADEMDMQQKLLLETVREMLASTPDGGKKLYGGDTAVFAAISGTDAARSVFSGPDEKLNVFSMTGAMPASASGRISYLLDIHGASVSADTACSSSFAVLREALLEIRSGASSTAIVCGVSCMASERPFIVLSEMGALSPSGVCRPYSDEADGYVRGEGCCAILLKRLEDAERDGDRIIGVIDAAAVGHDGASSSFCAPNGLSQRRVIADALKEAAIAPSDVQYVEGHGTGTKLGDPIELQALGAVYGEGRREALPVSSLKSQIGHLEAAAGLASLIKVLICMGRGTMPVMPMSGKPASSVDWAALSLEPSVIRRPWPDRIKRAGISSFGITGTNAHVIVSSAAGQSGGRKVIFAMPGQGSTGPVPIDALCAELPVFGKCVERAEKVLLSKNIRPIREILRGGPQPVTTEEQCAAFVYAFALAEEFISRGARPDCLVGHSVGELAAAAVSGMVDFEDALDFVYERAAAMERAPERGAMYSFRISQEEALRACRDYAGRVCVAAVNGPKATVLSGGEKELSEIAQSLEKAGISGRRLRVPLAAHSPLLGPTLGDIEKLRLAGVRRGTIPVISALSGEELTPEELGSPVWRRRHCRECVRFAEALRRASGGGEVTAVEFGVHRVLAPSGASVLPGSRWIGASSASRKNDAASPEEAFEDGINAALTELGAENIVRSEEGGTCKEKRGTSMSKEKDVYALLEQITGKTMDGQSTDKTWFTLGFDSLVIVQIQQGMLREFGWSPAVEDYSTSVQTPSALAAAVSKMFPEEQRSDSAQSSAASALCAPVAPSVTSAPVQAAGNASELMSKQIDAMQELFKLQLSILGHSAPAQPQPAQTVRTPQKIEEHQAPQTEIKGLFKDYTKRSQFTPAQQAYAARLAADWNALSPTSKIIAARDRKVLANPRSMIGFRPEWKELVYPLIVTRAKGSKVWDADGREYVDITGAFGAALFGHSPDFVTKNLEQELSTGWPLGPHRERNGRVAEKLCRMTGAERVAFFTSGTESTMVAVRLARSVLKRPRIALFAGAFHGSFDGLLASGWIHQDKKTFTSVPVTDGTTQGMIDDVIVLHYGDEKALDAIRNNASELAAVIVEPVQSRNPALQPVEFVKKLRSLTEEFDIALIFDEMITGFRMAQGGVQELWGIKPDMVTYGKVLGGGMPIGAVAGKRRFLDAVDGGAWNYGDDTQPVVHTAFVAGTFNQHPLTMAAAEAVLDHLEAEGPELQKKLSERAARMCERLDAVFEKYRLPIKMAHFGSLFRFDFKGMSEIMNFSLLKEGIFVWEGRNCFISTAHSDDDIEKIISAVDKSASELAASGWFPSTGEESIPRVADAEDYPASQPQMRLWLHDQMDPGLCVYNMGFSIVAPDGFNEDKARRALETLAERHESLRTAFREKDGSPRQYILPRIELPLTVVKSSDYEARSVELAERPFDLSKAPLWRAELLRGRGAEEWLSVSIHHAVSDVWSFGIFMHEFIAAYNGSPMPPLPHLRFRDYAAWRETHGTDPARLEWMKNYLSGAKRTELPPDKKRGAVQRFHGGNLHAEIDAESVSRLWKTARDNNCTFFAVVTALWCRWLSEKTGSNDLLFGTINAGRTLPETGSLIGFFAETLPIRVKTEGCGDFGQLVREVRKDLVGTASHLVPFDELLTSEETERIPGRSPMFDVMLVQDSRTDILPPLRKAGWDALETDTLTVQFDYLVYVSENGDKISLKVSYDTDLFEESTARRWTDEFASLLRGETRSPVQLSAHQQRLWFVDRFEKNVLYDESPVYYNMPSLRHLGERLCEAQVRHALDLISGNYDIFSLSIGEEHGQPVTRMAEKTVIPLEVCDFAVIDKKISEPFDMEQAPLARCFLSEDGADLCLVAHHIIADRKTLSRLTAEIEKAALDESWRPAPNRGYADVAATESAVDWQKSASAAWWKKELDGMGKIELPCDEPRMAIHMFEGGRKYFRASALPMEKMRAAFAALLFRLTGQDDIVVGDAEDGPSDTAGPVLKLLPLRLFFKKETGLDVMAADVEHKRLDALSHSDIPFDEIVIAAAPKNDMSRMALFDVLFVGADDDGTQLLPLGFGKYDIVFAARENGECAFSYNRKLISDASAEKFARRMKAMTEIMASAPQTLLDDTDMLLPEERTDVALAASAAFEKIKDIPETLNAAFRAAAAKFADRTAVSDAGRDISYAELDAESNRIANAIIERGGDGECTAVFLNRSWLVPAAFLGVLKSGSGYVPMDPAYPDERLGFMLSDCGAEAVVTERAMAERVKKIIDDGRLECSVVIAEDINSPASAPEESAAPDSLAYVIYTSGSTGRPRGVMVEHRNVLALIFQKGLPFSFSERDVWTMFHSPCFDFSVWEMYGSLLNGGRLVIVPREEAASPERFARLLSDFGVTVLNMTPTAFYALAPSMLASGDDYKSLGTLIFGGEALRPSRLAEWHKRFPQVRIVNMYGITETTVHVTWADIGDAEIAAGRSIIGVPIPAWGTVILDERLRQAPQGVRGEICVFGGGVARGYLNDAAKSAAKFIEWNGIRLYRSGDLGRMMADGSLEYLGRMDDQVKIRGFRVELGEVERALLSHPAVRDAVAMPMLGDNTGDNMGEILAAYIVPRTATTREALARHLAETLPDYMIPSRILTVKEIPLTGNGKTDRRKLAKMECSPLPSELDGRSSSGAGDICRAVCGVWKEVLGVPKAGPDDNFFFLGGHSLKANQAVVRIKKALGVDLTLKEFFTAPTPALLADLISRKGKTSARQKPCAEQTGPSPLSAAQERLWAWQQKNSSSTAYNMVGGFKCTGSLDIDRLQKALDKLVERHEALRTRFSTVNGEPVQTVDAPSPFVLEIEDADDDKRGEEVLAEEMRFHFDLENGPLIKVRLVREPCGVTFLIFNMHHIISDGWSVNVMMRDLEKFYSGTEPEGRPLQCREFAALQNEAAAEGDHGWWKSEFEELPLPMIIRGSKPRPEKLTGHGAMQSVFLGKKTSAALRGISLKNGASLFMTLESLLVIELSALSGLNECVIGTPVTGRDTVEKESAAGFLLNMLPLKLKVNKSKFSEHLAQIRDMTLEAFSDQNYPFDMILRDIKVKVPENRHPLFDIIMILQNNEPLRLDLPGVKCEPLADRSVTSRYDLNFQFDDADDIKLDLEYSTDIFGEGCARAIANGFAAAAAAAAEGVENVGEIAACAAPRFDENGKVLEEMLKQSGEKDEW